MGQKVNPTGYRLALTRDWRSRWYANPKEYPDYLHTDIRIRAYLKRKLQSAAVAKIVIERAWNSLRVTLFTARPGIVIGRKGAEIEKMTEDITRMSGGKQVKIDIQEIKTPELEAQLVAENIALQLERRISFRRAMKKALQTTMDFGALGVKLRVAGRLGGAEISRAEQSREGKTPLHTLRAHIDYGFHEAHTLYGKIGVKCWICKRDPGVVDKEAESKEAEATANRQNNRRGGGGDRRDNRGGGGGDRGGNRGGGDINRDHNPGGGSAETPAPVPAIASADRL
jgi:small subunit ribosomal protein S3